MRDFLRKAFGLAVSVHDSINNAFDYVGYLGMRAAMDSRFLSIDSSGITSPPIRMAVDTYDMVKTRAQSMVFNQLELKLANGDVGPKPDIKPTLTRILGSVAQNLPRIALSHSAVVALTITTGIVAAHLLTNGQFTQALGDAMTNFLGASPNSQGPTRQP